MTTDTKAVARWDWDEEDMHAHPKGDYVLFADHEQVVAELDAALDRACDLVSSYFGQMRALNEEIDQLRSALAAKSAEVEGLRDAMFAVYSVAANGGSLSRLHTEIERMRDAMEKGNV